MDKGIAVARGDVLQFRGWRRRIVMMILALVRNYIPSYGWVVRGGSNMASTSNASTRTSKA